MTTSRFYFSTNICSLLNLQLPLVVISEREREGGGCECERKGFLRGETREKECRLVFLRGNL